MPRIDYYALDGFTKAYIWAALWSSTDDDGNPLDNGRDHSDLADKTLAKMAEDCARFQLDNRHMLTDENMVNHRSGKYTVSEMAGHDFWLTRCGHGAGFWDGDWVKGIGEELTESCKAFRNVDLYIGDDGLIYA